jgi:hypothetical protein
MDSHKPKSSLGPSYGLLCLDMDKPLAPVAFGKYHILVVLSYD